MNCNLSSFQVPDRTTKSPGKYNVVVDWLTLLLRIMDVPASDLVQRPAILTEDFRGFPQSLQANAGLVL
jgi:hypothetical protein